MTSQEYNTFLKRTQYMKPLYIVLGTGCFVFGFCFWRYLLHSVTGMLVMRTFDITAYTKLSWVLLVYTLIETMLYPHRNAMVPLMLMNFVGLSASFQVSILLDNTSFSRLSNVCNWTMTQFHIINFLSHILPVFILTGLILQDPVTYVNSLNPVGIHAGWCTALFHLSWAFFTVGGLDLSILYVPFDKYVWYTMWFVSVVAHVSTGAILYCVIK